MSQFVIVILTSGQCEQYPELPCVLRVLGPFASHKDAEKEFRLQDRMGHRPHWMPLEPPESEIPGMGA
jgi:hypothetical protein